MSDVPISKYVMATLLEDKADLTKKDILAIEVSDNKSNKSSFPENDRFTPSEKGKSTKSGGRQDQVQVEEFAFPKLIEGFEVEDASSYLERVKKRYGQNSSTYGQFLGIMKDFNTHFDDIPGVIKRVSKLFKGDRELILGFNSFLPPPYEIGIDSFNREFQKNLAQLKTSQKVSLRNPFSSLGRTDFLPTSSRTRNDYQSVPPLHANYGTFDISLVGPTRGPAKHGSNYASLIGPTGGLTKHGAAATSLLGPVVGHADHRAMDTTLVVPTRGRAKHRVSDTSLLGPIRGHAKHGASDNSLFGPTGGLAKHGVATSLLGPVIGHADHRAMDKTLAVPTRGRAKHRESDTSLLGPARGHAKHGASDNSLIGPAGGLAKHGTAATSLLGPIRGHANHRATDTTLVGSTRRRPKYGALDTSSVGPVRGHANHRATGDTLVGPSVGQANYGASDTASVGPVRGRPGYRASYTSLPSPTPGPSRRPRRNTSPTFGTMLDQAVVYVDKVKARYGEDTDKYRRFNELLLLYHRDNFPFFENESDDPEDRSKEVQVYWDAAEIFGNDEDLLAEFGKYLPDELKQRPSPK